MTAADPVLQTVWRFVRGDMEPRAFESWLATDATLEARLGEQPYFDVIAAHYGDPDAIDGVKRQLRAWAETHELGCRCITLPDLAVVDFDPEYDRVFGTFVVQARRGGAHWWLSMDRCAACGQVWLHGAEERQNDIACLRRLPESALESILGGGTWPDEFDAYEQLLRIGRDAGRSVRFVDLLDSSLEITIVDLARERPGIRTSEIRSLLNLDAETAVSLAHRVVDAKGLQITFDG